MLLHIFEIFYTHIDIRIVLSCYTLLSIFFTPTVVLGTQKIVYLNDDPADGFVIIHQNTMGEETYLVATRTKNPSDQLTTIETALLKLSLDPKKFTKKPTNFGTIFLFIFISYIHSSLL